MVRLGEVPPDKISIVPCGVDTHLFEPSPPRRAKRHLSLPDKRYILFAGRIDPIKGIDVLLKAMGIVKDHGDTTDAIRLLIIGGDGNHPLYPRNSEMHKLRQLTTRLGLSDMVTFLGPQKQELLPFFYAAAEMCVLPSRYESFGMVALEAMACGRPVIASHVGGLPSFIQDNATGFLVPGGNEKVLAEKMLTLLNDASLRARMGKEAREKAKEFSWQKIAMQMIALYTALTEERKSGINTFKFPSQRARDRLSVGVHP